MLLRVLIKVMMKPMQKKQRKQIITKRISSIKKITISIEVSCRFTQVNLKKPLVILTRAHKRCMLTKFFTQGISSLTTKTSKVLMLTIKVMQAVKRICLM